MALAVALAVAIAAPLALAWHAWVTNGGLGIPLDDSWIHLTYARTLREHGSFAYFPGDATTAGSTSPLFTLLLALGSFATANGKLLGLGLGFAAQIAFLATFAAWARRRLGSDAWAAAAVLLVGLDGRVATLAVSGMETSLFLFLVALAFHARCSGRAVLTGAALGLALWVRPDALMLAAVFAVDAGLARVTPVAAASPEAPSSRERAAGQASAAAAARAPDAAPGGVANGAWRAALVFLALAVAYGAFNLAVGGRLLPDTFAAKTAFYAGRSRWGFLTGDVAECFGTGAWLLLAPFALGALAREVRSLARRAPGVLRLEAGWVVVLPLAYLVLLPYAHRFMRYLVPALPALAVLGLGGVQAVWRSRALRSWIGSPAARRAALAGVALIAATLLARAAADSDGLYLYACRYHAERNERVGRWLADHTPADAVVATHDVGAIAFESRRRIVDTVGLVSPEVIPWIGRPGYERRLEELFTRRGVGYVAVFDDWLTVDNVAPLFTATPEPEVMRVFPWIPGRAHLVPEAVARAQVRARSALDRGDAGAALAELRIALELDRESAGAWTLLAQALARLGRRPEAEQAARRALALFPDSPAARAVLAALAQAP